MSIDKIKLLKRAIEKNQKEIINVLLADKWAGLELSTSQIGTYAKSNIHNLEVQHYINLVLNHLTLLEHKKRELERDREDNLASSKREALDRLVMSVKRGIKVYIDSSLNQDALATFQETCNTSIEKAKPTLERHRGFKSIFANFLITVSTLGIANLTQLVRTRGEHGFFTFNTDSGEKLNDMKKAINVVSRS